MNNKTKALEYLNIPRSSFYYHSIKDEKDLILKVQIEKVLSRHPSYGHKRISIELHINRKRIRRVMKKYDLRPRRGRRKPCVSRKMGAIRGVTKSFGMFVSFVQKSHMGHRFYIYQMAWEIHISCNSH